MREIKFRAWDKKNNTMVKIKTLFDHEIGTGLILIDGYVAFCRTQDGGKNFEIKSYIDCELMQYTGLKDKNGKEIYEGDIIKDSNGKIGKIVHEGCSWNVRFGEKYYYPLENYFNIDSINIEIISNIYENPELLK